MGTPSTQFFSSNLTRNFTLSIYHHRGIIVGATFKKRPLLYLFLVGSYNITINNKNVTQLSIWCRDSASQHLIMSLFFKNGPFPASFSSFSSFQYTIDSKQMFNINKFLPMTWYEPRTSGIGSNRSTNWATQPLPYLSFLDRLYYLLNSENWYTALKCQTNIFFLTSIPSFLSSNKRVFVFLDASWFWLTGK